MHVPAVEYTSAPEVTPQPVAVPSATVYDTDPVPEPPADASVNDCPYTNVDADVIDRAAWEACATVKVRTTSVAAK